MMEIEITEEDEEAIAAYLWRGPFIDEYRENALRAKIDGL